MYLKFRDLTPNFHFPGVFRRDRRTKTEGSADRDSIRSVLPRSAVRVRARRGAGLAGSGTALHRAAGVRIPRTLLLTGEPDVARAPRPVP